MPSRKQRRKREKLQRHEYEYVLETDEGEEVIDDPRTATQAAAPGNGKPAKQPVGPVDRHGKPIQKPSLQRVLRRTAIFAPLIAALIYFTTEGLTLVGLIFNVVLLLAFFMPLSYVVDMVVYRLLWRRWEKERAAKRAGAGRG
jgi:hypothetical protein